ncbi:MAG TPA: cysteine peptidase family C39 domain-containing protein, partial [Fimbriimonadaceae bacterium]|nr:cysteine peptidase family C39 domain-containing protein [Fimbriimonadaceae bacterium]
TFVNIEKDYSGTGVSSPDFGKLDDQAAYQAIVCLQADGKKKEAIAEYLKFLKERPSSPLIQGVLNRLKRLEPKRTDEFEAAFQRAYDEQERLRHIDMAKCGPRAALYLFQSLGDRSITEDQIFEACGTTVDGTTMKGLIDGLAKFGMTAKGYSLNWNDFKAAQKPLFWLNMNHYVLVLETTDDSILFYDPLFKTKRTVMVPEDGTAKFSANVLTLDLDAYLRRQQGK